MVFGSRICPADAGVETDLAEFVSAHTGVWVEVAVFDEGGEPGELTLGTALAEVVPLHSLMAEKIVPR